MCSDRIPVTPLGQAGLRIQFPNSVVYVDPYLSNYVEKIEGEALRRMVPIRLDPAQIGDADYVLITHAHIDHCDPDTVVPMAAASPSCRFVGPLEVSHVLQKLGIGADRIVVAREEWIAIADGLRVRPVPAAHPAVERDDKGNLKCVGYVLEFKGRRIYHAGDTSLSEEIFEALSSIGRIDVAILPVNERNYYRERAGIIGNMTVREAFRAATDLGVSALVPVHWDMFKVNSVFPEEIELLHKLMRPNFQLLFNPGEI